ncbi:phage major capsid protein, P2 family [Escherichia coli]|uniref:phage major capsid protein, P2 family n=2 Tax=Escherichia coli TaxID=562 RepID=UPI000BE8DD04|nr:phage major capsid protein, P2 family [Escherichia coli]MBI0776745.1 phage major capsid protein, P2 family [Escherichia coli]
MHLNNRARDLLDKYSAGMAQHFGARDTSRYFSLNDPQENALRLALLESVEFLNMITCLDVDQLSGQVISVGSSVLHTGRSENGRFIRRVGVDGNDYSLVETDSCAALRWDLLSVWANAGKDENEFFNLVQAFTTQAFALDMLRIGFNGKSRAKTTDPEANPNGEDVNVGWHERMKTLLGGNQIMTDPVVLDEAGDYKSLDAMASDLINAKIPAQFRNDPRLVVLVGADLVAAEQYRLYQAADRPTEKIAAQMLGSTIAGRQAIIQDYIWYQLPDGSLYVGGVEKSLFAGRPVEIPSEFSQGAAGGNSVTLPVIQTIRPGVEMNGERVTKVHLTNDTMAITWTPRNRATGKPLQKTPAQRQIESHYPELASGLHLPKMARVVAHSEPVKSGNFADPFRPRYAVDVQLLDADGNPDNQTPVYSAVPLPVPMAGNDSGMFQFPPEGTLVEVAFTGGRPDKPFIRQTLPNGTSLPDVKPGEQLQQQREEVSQRVTLAGDWVRQTDQTISETSMVRTVKADTEQRDLVSRETTVKATDKTIVVGTATLLAGAFQQVSAGDFSQAVKGNRLASIEGNEETDIAGQQSIKVGGAVAVEVGESLTEKIAALRKSVAAGGQQVMGETVHIGSENINALTMMLDTIDLLAELALQCANHSHPTVGTPTNAAAFTQTATKAGQTRSKYQNIIA